LPVRVGIDTGGTFSDFVAVDSDTGEVHTAKVPSTPSDPAAAIRAGLELLGLPQVEQVVVGTTVATNAVIERRGARVVFVTNEGFTDVPFIGRLDKERLYDLHWEKPKPLVKRADCVGVAGRRNHHGEVVEPVEAARVEELVAQLRELDDEFAVAISCLFSYVAPDDERAIASSVRAAFPDAAVSVSHEVSPVWREHERASTTIADAFVKPIVDGYVDGVGSVLQGATGVKSWNMLSSNGGHLRAESARERPVQLLLSGLAGGVVGARYFAEQAGHASVFSLDMGGTSCDIGLVLDGEQQYASEFQVSWGIPVSIPCVSVTTIGAGGGSICWIDKGGFLHVGPQSAGADPGPVAYGKGGTSPTTTDANLVLGRLDPDYFLGGRMPVDAAASRDAFEALGESLGLSPEAAALASVRTTDENMANAIRLVAVERGLDSREFALIAFGGAGPLHARAVAERLEMTTVLIPPHPGLCSAFGAVIAQPRVDRVQTYYARSDNLDAEALAAAERGLREEAVRELRRTVDAGEPLLDRAAALRYAGQNYELEVPLAPGDLDSPGWEELRRRFEVEHERQYGFALPAETVELVNLRVTAIHPEPLPEAQVPPPTALPAAERQVWFDASGPVACGVIRRETLAPGDELTGPLVIEEPDSTTLLHPGDGIRVDASGVLLLTLGAAA
jgi:N-methylhydantoinase A